MPKYSTTYQTRRPPARPSTPSQNGPTRTAPGSASSGVMRHTAELGRIWSGGLSRGDERWPDESRCPLGLTQGGHRAAIDDPFSWFPSRWLPAR